MKELNNLKIKSQKLAIEIAKLQEQKRKVDKQILLKTILERLKNEYDDWRNIAWFG